MPPTAPKPLVHRREIDHVTSSLLERFPVAVVGKSGAGSSTVAIEAARAATRDRGRLIYLDFAHIVREDEAVRKILLAAGVPLRTLRNAESPPVGLIQSYLDDRDVVVLDNLSDISIVAEIQASLTTPVTVSRVSPRGSHVTLISDLAHTDAELLFNLPYNSNISERVSRTLISVFGRSVLCTRLAAGIASISENSRLFELLRMAEDGNLIEALAVAVWKALPEEATRVLSAILITNWTQVNVSQAAQIAHIPRGPAKSSLELLAQIGVLAKVSNSYRPQRTLAQLLPTIKLAPREYRTEQIDATLLFVRARVRRLQRALEQADIGDSQLRSSVALGRQSNETSSVSNTLTRTNELANDVAWLEREWTAIERLLEQQARERPGSQVSEIVDSLRVSLRPLGRIRNLRRLEEFAYLASRAAGGLRQQRDAAAKLADTLEREGKLADAIAARREALVLAREAGNQGVIGQDLVDLARLRSAAGQPSLAIKSLEEAVAAFRDTALVDDESRTLVSLGALYEGAGKVDGAADAYARALRLLDEPDRASERANILLRLGAIHQSRGRLQEAMKAYAAAGEEGRDDPSLVAWSFEHLGGLLMIAERFPEAISALEKALTIYRDIADRARELSTLLDWSSRRLHSDHILPAPLTHQPYWLREEKDI